jgi:mRNA-degrading endonuclease RelE of RelBE toxin-antitoxin system
MTYRAEEEIEALAKKAPTKKVKEDICDFFKKLDTIEKIREVDETMGVKGKFTTCKKTRLKNSIINEKDGGYRIYFLVSEKNEVVVISSIYSKKKIDNYSKDEIKRVFKAANDEIKNGTVQAIDINKKLKKLNLEVEK